MPQELLLESHLKQLRSSSFLDHYQPLAHYAACTNLSYERYLLALAQGGYITKAEPVILKGVHDENEIETIIYWKNQVQAIPLLLSQRVVSS